MDLSWPAWGGPYDWSQSVPDHHFLMVSGAEGLPTDVDGLAADSDGLAADSDGLAAESCPLNKKIGSLPAGNMGGFEDSRHWKLGFIACLLFDGLGLVCRVGL